MGSCVSFHKDADSAVKIGVAFRSKHHRVQIPESPVKASFVNGDATTKSFQSYGSKEETFFDSQPWLDSDCEDDFYSVNGDFTPSRGNTPAHHRFGMGTPKHNKTTFENKPPSPRPTLKTSPNGKKRLSELLQESSVDEQDPAENKNNTPSVKAVAKPTILDVLRKSASSTPYISGTNSVCGSERTANGDPLFERERSIKSKQSCLPSLMSCRSFSERKKRMSPAITVNDEA